ncbi:MAG: hypothetical protein MUF48_00795 [Pirellulaceae bacterium]|jgi:hypothetical protein|nr:hypothetical protein [Pirellulaceae bacterium]
MRRLCVPLTLLVAVSSMIVATATAQAPPGRVVNPNAARSVKKTAPPAPARPAPARPTPAPEPMEALPQEMPEAPEELIQEEGEELAEITAGEVKRTYEQMQVTEDEKRRAALAQQQAAAEEQQMAGRVRGLQQLIEREEQLLVQRMTYAAKLREKGLTTNDQQLLDQAERYERAALAEYQKKVRHFESMSVVPATPPQQGRAPAPARPSQANPKGNASASRPQPRR